MILVVITTLCATTVKICVAAGLKMETTTKDRNRKQNQLIRRYSSGDKEAIIELDSFLPYQISLLADIIARNTTAVARQERGLNLSQWRVMAAVAEKPGRSANEVVVVTPMDKGIVSRAVKSLIDLKLIERRASQEDGRIARLFLTADGEASYRTIAAAVRRNEATMTEGLTEQERDLLGKTLMKMMKHADQPISVGTT